MHTYKVRTHGLTIKQAAAGFDTEARPIHAPPPALDHKGEAAATV